MVSNSHAMKLTHYEKVFLVMKLSLASAPYCVNRTRLAHPCPSRFCFPPLTFLPVWLRRASQAEVEQPRADAGEAWMPKPF
jgi:hypothetical protein